MNVEQNIHQSASLRIKSHFREEEEEPKFADDGAGCKNKPPEKKAKVEAALDTAGVCADTRRRNM